MIKAKKLKHGDNIAIVSLSNGILGEEFCKHDIMLGKLQLQKFGLNPVFMPNCLKGVEFLKNHPEARAADLKYAFMDDSIKGIICAIGGDDTFRLIPYLMEDKEFLDQVKTHPKIFSGFSDTTINHLMFYKMGLVSYYGPSFINDFAELEGKMLEYTKEAFEGLVENHENKMILSSNVWYDERTDFSSSAVGTKRIEHKEMHGYELLQGKPYFSGRLLGGCIDSIYNLLIGDRYPEEKDIEEKYHLFPDKDEWKDKIIFLETSENKMHPNVLKKVLTVLKSRGIFEMASGIIIGKPQDEVFYEEYKEVYKGVINNEELPIVYNVNFGHSFPRTILPYGVEVLVDVKKKSIRFIEDIAI